MIKILTFSILFVLTLDLMAASTARKDLELEFEALNDEIRQELLIGDLTNSAVKKELNRKIRRVALKAKKIGGRKFKRYIYRSYKKTIKALNSLGSDHREILETTYKNGLTGREILVEVLDPFNSLKINKLYQDKTHELTGVYSRKELVQKSFDAAIKEAKSSKEFSFLNIEPVENYVLNTSSKFDYFYETCTPAYGDEDFHLLIFGYNRCSGKQFDMERWTVGPGYFFAEKQVTYMAGVKVGNKNFKGFGARAQVGAFYGAGLSVYIGNGFVIAVDIENGSGAFAGLSYLNLKLK